MVVLSMWGRDIPHGLAMLVAGTFGSLASFLVQPPRGSVGLPGATNGNGNGEKKG
jgi:hypothetical protein